MLNRGNKNMLIDRGRRSALIGAAFFVFSVCAHAQPGRPSWISNTPESTAYLYFTGMAEADTESAARSAAAVQGHAAIAGFYGRLVQAEMIDTSVFVDSMGKTIIDKSTFDEKTISYSNAVLAGVEEVDYYTESSPGRNGGSVYKVWVLCRVSRQRAEADAANFAKNISEQYLSLINSGSATLYTALHAYTNIINALDADPLHKAVAYHEGAGGRASLYEYCRLQINNLVNSVSFADLPSLAVEKGETLNVTVRLSPGSIPRIGNIPCRVDISGMGNGVPAALYAVGPDNSFPLRIPTASLASGPYTVQLELLLNEYAPGITRNPTAGFSFRVKSLDTVRIQSNDENSRVIEEKVGELLQAQGFTAVKENSAYLVRINIDMEEGRTANYYTVQPGLLLTVELVRDGTSLVNYRKKYPLYRHISREEAYSRAHRNIEQDLAENLPPLLRSLEK
jgi:hypothetical protein